MPGKIENIMEDFHEFIIERYNEKLDNNIVVNRSEYDKILREFNKKFSFLSDEEKEIVEKQYADELKFLRGITDKKTTPSKYISHNIILLDKIKSKVKKKDEAKENKSEYLNSDSQKEKIETNKYIQDEKKNLDELYNILDSYDAINKTYSSVTPPIDELRELEEKLKPIADFFHYGSTNKNKEIDKNLFDDKRHESLELLNDIRAQIISIEISDKWMLTLGKDVNENNVKYFKEAQEYIIQKREKLEKIKEYYESRLKYYKDKKLEGKYHYIDGKIKVLDGILYTANRHIEEANEGIKIKDIVETEDKKEDIIEDFSIAFENFEPVEIYVEKIKSKETVQSLKDEVEDIENNDFEHNQQGIIFEEGKDLDESLNLFSELDNKGIVHEEAITETSDEVDKSKSILEDDEYFNYLSENAENEVFDETVEHIESEESIKNTNLVTKRISDMISDKKIDSNEKIQDELDEIFREMSNPIKKRKTLFKTSLLKKEKSIGNINERIFMDIRTIFARLNKTSKFLNEEYADEFARKLFNNGIPQYMSNKEMDENLKKEFLTGITKYIEMAESDIFSQEEKECFEKFVLGPYILKSIQKDEKELSSKLKDDTFSMEDIIKNSSKEEKNKEIKVRDLKSK